MLFKFALFVNSKQLQKIHTVIYKITLQECISKNELPPTCQPKNHTCVRCLAVMENTTQIGRYVDEKKNEETISTSVFLQAVMRHYIGKKHGILDKFVKEELAQIRRDNGGRIPGTVIKPGIEIQL